MKISVCGKTDRGRRRLNNEDDLTVVDLTAGREISGHAVEDLKVAEKGILLAVADGVGGRRAGEIASGLALDILAREIEVLAPTCPRRELFRRAVEKVNERVWREACGVPERKGMATTLTAAVVCPERAVLAHVGDSRAHILRGGKMRQITRDQSYVQSLVDAGVLGEEEAEKSPYRNVILQAIGKEKRVEVALDALDLEAGDLLLLCTDGLSDKVSPDEMAERLSCGDVADCVEGLIALANERGGEDNITVVACRVDG